MLPPTPSKDHHCWGILFSFFSSSSCQPSLPLLLALQLSRHSSLCIASSSLLFQHMQDPRGFSTVNLEKKKGIPQCKVERYHLKFLKVTLLLHRTERFLSIYTCKRWMNLEPVLCAVPRLPHASTSLAMSWTCADKANMLVSTSLQTTRARPQL